MAEQIRRTDNDDSVHLFLKYLPSEIDPDTGELFEKHEEKGRVTFLYDTELYFGRLAAPVRRAGPPRA